MTIFSSRPLFAAAFVLLLPLLSEKYSLFAQTIAPTTLPAEGIYPRGRKMAFMGYSGVPSRDMANGWTVAGPVYGNQQPYLESCFAANWPVIAHIGPHVTFNDKSPTKYKLDEPSLREQVEAQVKAFADHPQVAWWAVTPEELRPWRKDEMKYLEIVCDSIRKNDPRGRPIYLYNPNNRDAKRLEPIARQVDVLAKGCYVNLTGHKRDRAWVRWSVEQEVQAIQAAGRPGAIPLLMPELCADPDPAEDKQIADWVRHDVYLGLASGAKGVLVWSLFKRGGVKRTWQLWYDAYSQCAKELNGERGLAQVFLFGRQQSTLQVSIVKGSATTKTTLGGEMEANTTSDAERAKRQVKTPAWTAAEFVYGGATWLFVINSANEPSSFSVAGWPQNSRAQNGFNSKTIELTDGTPLAVPLGPYGVAAFRFDAPADSRTTK